MFKRRKPKKEKQYAKLDGTWKLEDPSIVLKGERSKDWIKRLFRRWF